MGRLLIVAFATLAIATLYLAHAAHTWASTCDVSTDTWTASAGGAWETGTNWSAGHAPTSSDYVCIPTGTGTITISSTDAAESVEAHRTVSMSGGSLTLGDPNQPSSFDSFSFIGGTISGAGNFTINTSMTWNGGTISGSGTMTVASGASFTVSMFNGSTQTLSGPLVNNGTMHMQQTTGAGLFVTSGGSIANNGSMLLDNDGGMFQSGSTGVITNSGTIRKTSGTITSTIAAPLVNNGTVSSATTGKVVLVAGDGGTAESGSFSNVSFSGGSYTLAQGAVFDGSDVINNNTSTPSFTLNGGVSELSTGTLSWSNGTISGAGNLSLNGSMTWTGGTLSGSGTVTVASGASMTVSMNNASTQTLSRPLVNNGTVHMQQANGGGLPLSASWTNNGSLLLDNDGTMFASGSTGVITNSGTIRKTTGTVTSTIAAPLVNNGTLNSATTGTTVLTGGDGGTAESGSFANVQFTAGSYTLAQGAVLDGTDSLPNTGSGAALTLTGAVTQLATGNLSMTTGTIAGAGSLTLNGSMTWIGGTISGTGPLTVASGASLTVSLANGSTQTLSEPLVNNGTVHMQQTNGGGLPLSFPWTNAGSLLLDNDGAMFATGSTGLITNSGTIRKTAGTGTSAIGAPVANAGTISTATTGTVALSRGDGGSSAGQSGTFAGVQFTGGSFTLAQGALLDGTDFVSGASTSLTLNGPVSQSSTGTLSISNGTVAGTGSLTVNGTLNVSGGTVSLPSTSTVAGTLNVSGGAIGGSGVWLVDGAMTWTGGTLSGSGDTDIAVGAALTITANNALALDTNHDLDIAGTATWNGGFNPVVGGAGSVIDNSGTLAISSNGTISDGSSGGTKLLLTNTGTLNQSSTSSTVTCGCDFDNQGTLSVADQLSVSGRLVGYNPTRQSLAGGTYQLSGQLRVPNLTIATDSSNITLNGANGQIVNSTNAQNGLAGLKSLTAAGALTLSGGANLTTTTALSSSGNVTVGAASTFTVGGVYTMTDGATALSATTSTLTDTGGASLTGGVLTGVGSIGGPLTNSGATITPAGAGVGTLTVSGTYSQSGTGALAIDITSTGNDELATTGAASLGGTLALNTASSYSPATGTVFTLVTYGSRTGFYSPITGAQLPSGNIYWLADTGTTLTATVKSPASLPVPTATINGGAARTNNHTVTVTITPPAGMTVTGMRLANDADPTGAFITYASPTSWTLPAPDGTHSVHVQLRDGAGNQTGVATPSIILDTTAPVATITAPTSSSGSATIAFNELVTGATTSNITLQVTSTGANLPTTITCKTSTGTTVDCGTGAYTQVILQPTAPLVTKVSYTITVNPSGAPTNVTDLAGNAAATTSSTFSV